LRFFIEIAYSGKNYAGWQSQKNAVGVQNLLEDCLSKLLREEISLTGSGRTDKGVHCAKQFAHFDCEKMPFDEKLFLHKINAFLPKDIHLSGIFPVRDNAHARFDAYERCYQYFFIRQKSPFFDELSCRYEHEINIEKFNSAARMLLGTHDFSSFCKLHSNNETNFCTVKEAFLIEKPPFLVFTISANRFLRGMVRLLTGSLLETSTGKKSEADFSALIAAKEVRLAAAAVPAEGLFLVNVVYPNDIFTEKKPSDLPALVFG
jgi:tRNA pseudouridine38-40 synthase